MIGVDSGSVAHQIGIGTREWLHSADRVASANHKNATAHTAEWSVGSYVVDIDIAGISVGLHTGSFLKKPVERKRHVGIVLRDNARGDCHENEQKLISKSACREMHCW